MIKFSVAILIILLGISASLVAIGQSRVNPIIEDFGGIFEIPTAAERPSNDRHYNIIIDVRSGPDAPDQINPSLNNIARLLNLHAVGGVHSSNMHIKAVIHNLATPVIATNDIYNQKYGMDNPNLEIIDALTEAGVELYVCGQSMVARDYPLEGLNPKIKQSISALTMLTQYQLEGYALLTF